MHRLCATAIVGGTTVRARDSRQAEFNDSTLIKTRHASSRVYRESELLLARNCRHALQHASTDMQLH